MLWDQQTHKAILFGDIWTENICEKGNFFARKFDYPKSPDVGCLVILVCDIFKKKNSLSTGR